MEHVDFSEYGSIFCDSSKALEWAYKQGLSRDAIVHTSSPALLWKKKPNIKNIEEGWNIDKLEIFQSAIPQLTEHVFDTMLSINGVEREAALVISQIAHQFQKIIYKAACLQEEDFTNLRLFIYVEGKTGPDGNIMNSPWDRLLVPNKLFSTVKYKLHNDDWSVLTTKGISFWQRFKVAGFESIVFRIATKIMDKAPNFLFKKELLMPNENELNIEIASSLILRGVRVKKVNINLPSSVDNIKLGVETTDIIELVLPIMLKRVEQWVVPVAVDTVMNIFKQQLEGQLKKFKLLTDVYKTSIYNSEGVKRAVLMNAPGSIYGKALSYVCRSNNIPLISSQHGVTVEISKMHYLLHIRFDNSVSDLNFAYNSKAVEVERKSYYDKSKHYVVGMPARLMRMSNMRTERGSTTPIVYISTNLYHMGLSQSLKTDYGRALDEHNLIVNVLSRLPHKVCYKTYPEDNRRYADMDPVLKDIKTYENIELFSDKIDMRYLISKYSVLVTTCATSTLSWPIMSGKPVIFIDQKNNNPLTDDAYLSLSKGIFVFDDNKENFYEELRDFLSQPIEDIEKLWQDKQSYRNDMIKNYFSAYQSTTAGKRASKTILRECF
jgi:hypothetical protein